MMSVDQDEVIGRPVYCQYLLDVTAFDRFDFNSIQHHGRRSSERVGDLVGQQFARIAGRYFAQ